MNPKNINEQFEDAVFSMLMADVAEAEGKRLLEVNKQLQGDPEAAVPEEVSSRCLKAIKREFNRRNLRNIRRTCARVFQRVAIVVLVVVACFSTMFVTSEAFRVEVMNYVIEIFDEKIDLGIVSGSESTSDINLEINWIPEGYSLIEQDDSDIQVWRYYQSNDNKDDYIYISILLYDENTSTSIDIENAEVEIVSLNGIQAIYSRKDSTAQITWLRTDIPASITIIGTNIYYDTLIKVAENISILLGEE